MACEDVDWDLEDQLRASAARMAEITAVLQHEQRKNCCTGIHGSHTARCSADNVDDRLTCWCCQGTFPASWAAVWSAKGSRCFECESHKKPCEAHAGAQLEAVYGRLPAPETTGPMTIAESTVHHPPHYNAGTIEHCQVVEDQGYADGYYFGQTTKYAFRAGRKPGAEKIEDLKKLAWYAQRWVAWTERGPQVWTEPKKT